MKNRNDWRTENFLYCMPIREVINVTRVFRISEKIQTLPFVFKNTCEEKSKDKFYDIFCFSKKIGSVGRAISASITFGDDWT